MLTITIAQLLCWVNPTNIARRSWVRHRLPFSCHWAQYFFCHTEVLCHVFSWRNCNCSIHDRCIACVYVYTQPSYFLLVWGNLNLSLSIFDVTGCKKKKIHPPLCSVSLVRMQGKKVASSIYSDLRNSSSLDLPSSTVLVIAVAHLPCRLNWAGMLFYLAEVLSLVICDISAVAL